MTPLDAAGFPQSVVAGHDEADPAHVASLRVNYLSLSPQARSASGMQLAQRSVSSVNCDLDTVNVDDGEAFDQDSVLYAQGVVSKIKKIKLWLFCGGSCLKSYAANSGLSDFVVAPTVLIFANIPASYLMSQTGCGCSSVAPYVRHARDVWRVY